jgi:hypothetical protein
MGFAMEGAVNGLFKLIVATVGVITAASAAAVLLLPATPEEGELRRLRMARRLVDQVAQETWNYYHERGEFPPGDGTGSAALVRALSLPSKTGAPYVQFAPEMLTRDGDLRNPVAPRNCIVHYRRNPETERLDSVARNSGTFDLWCMGPDGRLDAVNNWE